MPLARPDLCYQTTTSTGTGDVILDGTVEGFRTFDQAIADGALTSGDTIDYVVQDGAEYEWGRAIVEKVSTQVFLRRSTGTITESNDGGLAIDVAGGGTTKVWAAIPATLNLIDDDRSDNGGAIAVTDAAQTFTGAQTIVGDVSVQSADAGASAAPILETYRNSASPAASDVLGTVRWAGEDSAGNKETYAEAVAVINDPTTTSEDAKVELYAVIGGVLTKVFEIGSGGAAFFGASLEGSGIVAFPTDGIRQGGSQLGAGIGELLQVETVGSPVASVDLDTGIDSSFDVYLITWHDVFGDNAAAANFLIQMGEGGADSGGTDYDWQALSLSGTATSSGGDSSIDTATNIATTQSAAGYLYLFSPSSASTQTTVEGRGSHKTASTLVGAMFNGMRNTAKTIDTVRFLVSANNIASGTFRLYGVRNS